MQSTARPGPSAGRGGDRSALRAGCARQSIGRRQDRVHGMLELAGQYWLLARCSLPDPTELAYYLCSAPPLYGALRGHLLQARL